MKKRSETLLSICAVLIVAAVIGVVYYRFVSQRIYEDSTGHLE